MLTRPSPRLLLCLLLWCISQVLHAAGFVPFSLEVKPNGTAPFAREISVQVRQPDGRVLKLPAFYEGDNRYGVRAMAYQKGEYALVGVVEELAGREQAIQVRVISPSLQQVSEELTLGRIIIDPKRPNRFASTSGEGFYPLGMNLAWPMGERLAFYKQSFSSFQQNGLNWTRIWCANWGGLNLDWLQDDLGTSPAPGELDARVAQLWDAILEDATQKGIYIQLVLQHHGQYSDKVDSNWAYNPWNAALPGGFLKTPSEFFTDERARRLTRQKYRYTVARFGWSPAIMAWELFNEVYQTDAYLKGHIQAVADWHNEMADYLRSIDPYKHLITTSLNDIRSPIWEKMDYLQPHLYAANVIDSVRGFYPSLQGITRPVFYGEVGDDAVLLPRELLDSGAPIISSMWSSIMGDSEYAAQPWYPERLLNPQRLENLSALSRFITANRLASRANLVAFQPALESDSKVSLVVPAGQWWNRRPAGFVQIPSDGRISPAITSVPRAFPGSPDSVADGYTNRAVIRAFFPKLSTAKLRLNDVGGYGAKLSLSVDGQQIISTTWGECMKGQPSRPQQPAVYSFVVQPGQHEIIVENPGGPDWFDFHSLDLGIDAPALAAAGRRSTDFVMLWVWHRKGLFEAADAAIGKILIDELPAGTWNVTWWDTIHGKAGPVTRLIHAGGALQLPTPPIAKDAAVALEKQP